MQPVTFIVGFYKFYLTNELLFNIISDIFFKLSLQSHAFFDILLFNNILLLAP